MLNDDDIGQRNLMLHCKSNFLKEGNILLQYRSQRQNVQDIYLVQKQFIAESFYLNVLFRV